MPEPRGSAKPTPDQPTASASEVDPGIFVGGSKDAPTFVGDRICVRDERPADLEALTGTFHLPIYDPARDAPIVENLDRVAERVHAAHLRGVRVLVFCGHGVRRGALATAWYLYRYRGLTLEQAFERIEGIRPQIERPQDWMTGWKLLVVATEPGPRSSDA